MLQPLRSREAQERRWVTSMKKHESWLGLGYTHGAALNVKLYLDCEQLDTETVVFLSTVTPPGVLNPVREIRRAINCRK